MVEQPYKQTDLGPIPHDWEIAQLDNILSVIDGDRGTNYPSSTDFFEAGYCLFLSARNVTNNGFKFLECVFITEEKDGSLRNGRINRQDIVLTTRGTVGNFAFFDYSVPFENIRINSGMVILRKMTDTLASNFLYVILRSYIIKNQIDKVVFGSAQPQLTVKVINNFQIPVPSLPEQRAIAGVLGDIDQLLATLSDLIAKKQAIKQAAMQQLLTGQTRLPPFDSGHPRHPTDLGPLPQDWEIITLGEFTNKIGSGVTPRGGAKVYKMFGRPFIRSQNVGWGQLRLDDLAYIDEETHASFLATEIKFNDVLLNITGASIGRSCIANEKILGGNVNQHVCIIRTKQEQLSPTFVNLFLLSNEGQRQISSFQAGGNREGLNFGEINSFQIKTPPSVEEQRAIARVLGDIDAEITALQARHAKTQALKQAAMQELLTGRTRLPH